MDSVIINFEKLKQEHLFNKLAQKEQLLYDCQQEILENEAQIRSLIIEINRLQANIDFNIKLMNKIKQQNHLKS